MPVTFRAQFDNLNEVRRDLEAVELGLGRELNDAIRGALSPLTAAVVRETPLGPGPQSETDDLPHVRSTITARPVGGGIVVESTHPAAGWLNFGGTISPKGTPITIRGYAMGEKAAEQQLPRIEGEIQRRIDALTARHGLS